MKGLLSDVVIAMGAGAGTRPEESTAPADDSPVKNGAAPLEPSNICPLVPTAIEVSVPPVLPI